MLNSAQQLTLKNSILADPILSALPPSSDSAFQIADVYNQPEANTWIVWKSFVTQDEIMQNGMDWTRIDNLSVGKARIWDWMFKNSAQAINPSKANIRAGIDATWVGTASDLAVRAAVYVHCKRQATRLEKILSSGTGSDASPATMGYEGLISYSDVKDAMGW